MNKADLITMMAGKAEMTKKDTEKALDAFMESVGEALAKNDKVTLVGFGTFEVRERKAREGVNPRTKEKIKIAGKNVPAFKAGKELKDSIPQKKSKK